MNRFAEIRLVASYRTVTFYSINYVDDDSSLFEKFVEAQNINNKDKLQHILSWIREIGNNYGAKKTYFREENQADALPPKGKNREPAYLEDGANTPNDLRLYSLRINENIVFLFGGNIKTENHAQNCPNVKEHFRLANQISKAISEAIDSNDIVFNDSQTDIVYEEDFCLLF
ncbi:MAG: hypothetical protein ACTHZ1_09210 [Sphingobacterium sp.]